MKKFFHPLIILTSIFSILVLLGAWAHPLWNDEAETALFARNINRFGIPTGWDGKNVIGFLGTLTLNSDLIDYTVPWPQFYLAAFSFRLFGESAFTARLPFVILSIASLPLAYLFVKKATGKTRVAVLTVLILSLSVPFVLYTYQARYYGMVLLSSLAMLLSALSLETRRKKSILCFLFGATTLLYSHYLSFAILYPSIFLGLAAWYIQQKQYTMLRRFIRWYIGLGLASVVLFLPWLLWMKPFSAQTASLDLSQFFPRFFFFLKLFTVQTLSSWNSYNALPIGLLMVYFFVALVAHGHKKRIAMSSVITLITLSYVAMMVVGSALFLAANLDYNFTPVRYHIILFVLFAGICAEMLDKLFTISKQVAFVAGFLLLFTTVFTLKSPRVLLFHYLSESMFAPVSPYMAVASYLNEHAKDGDTAFVNFERDHNPLIFLLKKDIRFVNRIHPADRKIFPKNLSRLPKYLYFFTDEPDWVILFSKRTRDGTVLTEDYRGVFPKGLAPTVNLARDYEETVLPIYFADMTSPQLEYHSFHEITPSYDDQIFIYHRLSSR